MRFRHWPPVARGAVLVAAGGWALVVIQGLSLFLPTFCTMTVLTPRAALASLDLALALNPPAKLAAGWILMLAAMMTPLVIAPLLHIQLGSLPRRRFELMSCFVIAYALAWMVAGAVLLSLAILLRLAAPSPWMAAGLVALLILAWHASPARQVCLNRRHARPPLPAFGLQATLAAIRFGAVQGAWCVGACWGVMLLPIILPHGHLAAMAGVALWQFADHLEAPRPPVWRWRWPQQTASTVLWLVRSLLPRPARGASPSSFERQL